MTTNDERAKPDAPESPDARATWGFPSFARDFPRHEQLDVLVAAFARGDYRAVRDGAPALAANADAPEDVRAAAAVLRTRIEPDPAARTFFVLTAALLAFLSVWWITHDGKASHPAAEPPAKVEVVK